MLTKLFEPILIFRIDHGGENSDAIECLEASGNSLFLGTFRGNILLLSLTSGSNTTTTLTSLWAKLTLNCKRPVQRIRFVSAVNRIFALLDGTLYLIVIDDARQFQSFPKIHSSVSSFALNDMPTSNNPYVIQMAVGTTRREICIFDILNDEFKRKAKFSAEEIPVEIVYDEYVVCYATKSAYYVIDLLNESTKKCFDITDPDCSVPIIKKISQNQYLLNASSQNLGMFTDGQSNSTRSPISWSSSNVIAIAYIYPYIIALGQQFISIYSSIDLSLKQQLLFAGGRMIGNYDGRLYLTTKTELFELKKIPWIQQVHSLLDDKLIDQALNVLENSLEIYGKCDESEEQELKRAYLRIGFVKFQTADFVQAYEMFLLGKLDVREILRLYPQLKIALGSFSGFTPPLHSIATVELLAKTNGKSIDDYTEFLENLLLMIKDEKWASHWSSLITNTLVKIFALSNNWQKMIDFLSNNSVVGQSIDLSDFTKFCQIYHLNASLACFLWLYGINSQDMSANKTKALDIWMKILEDEPKNEGSLTLSDVFNFLTDGSCPFHVCLQNLDWLLERDSTSTLKLLILYGQEKIDEICRRLENHPRHTLAYLQDVVLDFKMHSNEWHMKVYRLYVQILNSNRELFDDEKFRKKFRRFLYESNSYPTLNTLKLLDNYANDFIGEKAILYGKLKRYDAALDIFVNEMNDCDAADEFCKMMTTGLDIDHNEKRTIFTTLLKTYLKNKNDNCHLQRVSKLLSTESMNFDPFEILKLLPDSIPIDQLNLFLSNSLMARRIRYDKERFQCAIAVSLSNRLLNEKGALTRKHFLMDDFKNCDKCSRNFQTVACILTPESKVVHKSCQCEKN